MSIMFGQEVHEAEVARIESLVPSHGGLYESEALCRAQESSSVTAARVVKTIYGHSLRYASGLDGFAIVASFRTNEWVESLKLVEHYAEYWQAQAPTRRYVLGA